MSTESIDVVNENVSAGPPPRSRRPFPWRVAAVVIAVLLAIPIWRALSFHARAGTTAPHPLAVAVTKVQREDLVQELTCDSELRPYEEIDLHAKVAGYLEKISVDIGDRVEAGQVIATIEVPELQDDIRRASAEVTRTGEEVTRAQAAHDEEHLTFSRLAAVDKARPNLIAQQDLDAAQARDQTTGSALAAAKAQVEVARAELNKLQTMLNYSRIAAPFGGVITERYVDPGAMIQSGISSSTQTLPLVRLSQNDRLRLDIPVSVSYVSRIKIGDPVIIRIDALDKTLTGTIARSNRRVDTATRTMKVELDVPNPDLQLIPGMYASAVLRLDHREHTLAVPVEAVSRQKTATVFVVNKENILEERTVTLGLETPRAIEVLSGLAENESVMIGNRTQVKAGQIVAPELILEGSAAP